MNKRIKISSNELEVTPQIKRGTLRERERIRSAQKNINLSASVGLKYHSLPKNDGHVSNAAILM